MDTIPSSNGAADILRFGTFELHTAAGELRKSGHRIALQEQPLRILIALLERPGGVISREALCQRLWPEGTFVDFEHSLNAAVRRLRTALNDDADVPRFIETVHKRGYRFITLDPAFRANTVSHAGVAPATIAHIVRKRARLAVLPFGPYDGFTDGLTAEAMTHLTQLCPPTIGVIARSAVERARREGSGAAEIGRTLAAHYLVDGHVHRDGNRVRITAQLVEAEDETNLWAQSFDRVMTDTLSLQSEVAEEIARAVTDALSIRRATATRI